VSMNKIGIQVQDLMSSPVITVTQKETTEEVAKIMSKNNFGSIIVTSSKGKLLGIITERDIVTRLTAMNRLPSEVKVEEVMSRPVVTIAPGKDIKEAAKSMKEHGIRRLVVVDREKIIGVITSRDIFDEMVTGER
jgi:CBS domain-containing protein